MGTGVGPGTPEHFDAVVVGSGFGGSVTAARLAEAGWRVCLLERGRAYPPGSFPRSPLGFKHNFWDPANGLYGMFDLWSFSGLDAVCASGLGGGSLIYANVFLRKDERWFVQDDRAGGGYENWPVTRADLDPHYDRVAERIGLQEYPLSDPPYSTTPKVLEYRDAARRAGHDWSLVPLAVTFANPGRPPVPGEPIVEATPNIHRRARETCRLCGECDVGCNYGAKNTLDYTYITAAWHAGAEVRTGCQVTGFEPRAGGGYAVHHVVRDIAAPSGGDAGGPARGDGSPVTLTCGHLVLSAGTLGTTWLMLRNRSALPGVSPALGQGFSGNGDLLTFALRARDGGRARVLDPGNGPVITSAIRIPDALDGGDGRGFYLEDAGYPQFVSWLLEALEEPEAIAHEAPEILRAAWARMRGRPHTEIGGLASGMFGDCDLSSGVLPLLGMGRDIPDGTMRIENGLLAVDWSKQGASAAFYDRVRAVSREIASQLGADFLDNPIWHANRVITVHALGGCRMGRDAGEGVVDDHGRVFGWPGLHIADGSVMPGPVGANPSFTIAALADRFADAMLEGPRQTTATRATAPAPSPAEAVAVAATGTDPAGAAALRAPAPAAPEDPAAPAAPAGVGAGGPNAPTSGPAVAPVPTAVPATPTTAVALSFTEEMKGYVTFGDRDFDRGYRAGKDAGTAFMFHLTITADDIDTFIDDPRHTGSASGWIESDGFGGRLPVTDGIFNLFVDATHGDKRMLYRLEFTDAEQHPLTLSGFKDIRRHHGLDLWTETTTLFTHVLEGHGHDAPAGDDVPVIAGGILHIHPLDFARQLTTFTVHPPDRVDALARFGALFAGELWQAYGP